MKISLRVSVPKDVFSSAKFTAEIVRTMRNKTAPDLKNMFRQTVEGWEHQPAWSARFWENANEIGVFVYPSGDAADQYSLVSLGSPPHEITPRKQGGFLRFQTGYSPSTTPGRLRSKSNRRFGGFVQTRTVNHPGFEARNFPETIRREYASTFERDMNAAIRDANK